MYILALLNLSLFFGVPAIGASTISVLWRARRAGKKRIQIGHVLFIWLVAYLAAIGGTVLFAKTSLGLAVTFVIVAAVAWLLGQYMRCEMSNDPPPQR